jgi:hypothetical protein
VETRKREYVHTDPETDEKWSSWGTEICKEVNATAEGVALYNSWTEEQRQLFVVSLH